MKFYTYLTMVFGLFLLNFTPVEAQSELLQSGPMTGYATMREVLLWVQTTKPAEVYFKYWNVNEPQTKISTKAVTTSETNGFVAQIIAAPLEPSQHYQYELYINGKLVKRDYPLKFQSQPIWKWRGDAPDFSFVTGSCAYINETQYDRPGKPYGSNYQIFNELNKTNADFMLWLGDNVYLREVDWDSKTGIIHRFTHARSLPEMQPLLANMHHIAIWDDHDYGTDNSDRSFPLKKVTQEVFKTFYPNPNYIFNEGNTGFYQWADCDFFLLDNRFWRAPDKRSDEEDKSILGHPQLQWLFDALLNSTASFKFIAMGGQFLNPMEEGESYQNCAPEERQYIIDTIKKLKINGVIFLTGDVHHSELSEYQLTETYPLYDLTVSPFTSGIGYAKAGMNPLQVEGTLVNEHNFAKMEVFGTLKDRTLRISIINSDGELKWQKEIKASSLKF